VQIEILSDSAAVAGRGSALVAQLAREAITRRGRFIMAASGGDTPWELFRLLAQEELCWDRVDIVQVDERVAPLESAERNVTHLSRCWQFPGAREVPRIHPMPVEESPLEGAAMRYAKLLEEFAGTPPVLDLVQLGLGSDGHTASLVPGDSVLQVVDTHVATTGEYEKRRRMTLTYPTIDRARFILWVVTGTAKAEVLRRFMQHDAALPASRVARDRALLLTDYAAAPSEADSAAPGVGRHPEAGMGEGRCRSA
jgi:6-phosphogluconolactonase